MKVPNAKRVVVRRPYRKGELLQLPKQVTVARLRSAAREGYSGAQYLLGVAYLRGEGVKCNLTLAARWMRKAASQGFAQAKNDLGALLTL